MKVYDLRGKPLGDPIRKEAYPDSPGTPLQPGRKFLHQPMKYSHLLSTRWYFDASDPANAEESARVIGELCYAAETWGGDCRRAYRPLHVVVDNFGGTVMGVWNA